MRNFFFCLLLALAFSPIPAQQLERRHFSENASPTGRAQALPRSSPERQGVSSTSLLAFVEAADQEIDAMHSFMLVRHGQVIAEGWWTPYNAQTPHVLYSLS
jgi:hypothetical protein